MKLTSNNYLFSNFNINYSGESTSKTNLSINNIYNLTTRNNCIEPANNFSNLLNLYFSNELISKLTLTNNETINNIVYFYKFDYLDHDFNEVKSRYFILNDKFSLFEINTNENILLDLNLKFNKKPIFTIFNEKLYIYSHNDLFLTINQDNYPIVLSDVLNIKSIVKYDKYTVFNSIENKFSIFYSELTDLSNLEANISNYNEIKLLAENGEIEKIFVYKNNIFVAQKYSISKIILQDDNYKIQSLCSIKSSIIQNSIDLIDDYVIFLTHSGLYIFDGNDTKQIFKAETNNLIKSNVKAISYNNKYYLKCNYFVNHIKEDLILEFDVENENCTFYKLDNIIDFYLLQTLNDYKLIVITNNNQNEIKFLDLESITSLKKYIRFNKLTFDETPVKVLNEIKIISAGKYSLTVSSEIQSSTFEINGVSYIRNIGIKGQAFEIEIESDTSFRIEAIYVKTTSYTEG